MELNSTSSGLPVSHTLNVHWFLQPLLAPVGYIRICFKEEQTLFSREEAALKHRTSGPGHRPLKTEAHM